METTTTNASNSFTKTHRLAILTITAFALLQLAPKLEEKQVNVIINENYNPSLNNITIMFKPQVSSTYGSTFLDSPKCPIVNCILTEEKRDEEIADAFVISGNEAKNIYNLKEKYRHRNQQFVALFTNKNQFKSDFHDHEILREFDMTMIYEKEEHIPISYLSHDLYMKYKPLSFEEKSNEVVFLSNSCSTKTSEFIKELMKYIKIDSYGSCLNNKESINMEGKTHEEKADIKLKLLQKYKFIIIIDEAFPGYITQQYYDGLIAGSVPVYNGAPDIDTYAPSNHSIIKISDYQSAKDLGNYLKFLSDDSEEYEKYLSWKTKGISEQFKQAIDVQKYDIKCQLCVNVAKKMNKLK